MNPKVSDKNEADDRLTFTLHGVNVSIANAIRRIILSEIPSVIFRTFPHAENKMEILKNNTRFTNEILKQRLSCIPVHMTTDVPYDNFYIEVKKTNNTDEYMYVTTEDFNIFDKKTGNKLADAQRNKIFPSSSLTKDYILFARLRPGNEKSAGETLHFKAEFDIGTGRESGMFSVASVSSYVNTIDPAKVNQAWSVKEKEVEGEMSPAELTIFKQNWMLLNSQRYFLDDSFDFTIESVGFYGNENLVVMACNIMLEKIRLFSDSVNQKTVEIKASETTMKNCYDITLKNEDYTLGKVLEFILHDEHYKNGVLIFCGFKKFHPHDDDSIIRIAFTENQDMMYIYDTLISVCSLASDVYSKIKTNFQEESI